MNNEIIKENGIKWGPYRLRIPFIHMRFLTGEKPHMYKRNP